MKDNLLPCPFCGGVAKSCQKKNSLGERAYYVRCRGCGVRTLHYLKPGAPEAAWNRRASVEG